MYNTELGRYCCGNGPTSPATSREWPSNFAAAAARETIAAVPTRAVVKPKTTFAPQISQPGWFFQPLTALKRRDLPIESISFRPDLTKPSPRLSLVQFVYLIHGIKHASTCHLRWGGIADIARRGD